MKSKTLLGIVATVIILAGFTSCISQNKMVRTYFPISQNKIVKAYTDKKQNAQSLASIKPSVAFQRLGAIPNNITEYTSVTQIDDLSIIKNSLNYPKRCDVLSGTHTITILHNQLDHDCHCQRFLGWYSVTFETKAGRTYVINADTDPETSVVDVYVTDEKSGERITSTVDYYYRLVDKE